MMFTNVEIRNPIPVVRAIVPHQESDCFAVAGDWSGIGIDYLEIKRIKTALNYDPFTGVFRWKIKGRGRRSNGIAGGVAAHNLNLLYGKITVNGKPYQAHRLAFLFMTGRWPRGVVDHLDGDGLNNAWSNLDDVSSAVNTRRGRLHKKNTSGVAGVWWYANGWSITIGTAQTAGYYLGRTDDFFEAICRRKSAENRFEGYSGVGCLK